MTTTDVIDRFATDTRPVLDPLMDTFVRLAPGMQTRLDRYTGDVPLLTVRAGRTHMVVGFDAAEVADVGAEHLALVEEFVTAAVAWREEVRTLLALTCSSSSVA